MPGPDRLEQVIGLLHAPDRAAAMASLCQQVVPGQTGPADRIAALVWATPSIDQTTDRVIAPFVPLESDRILGAAVRHVRLGQLDLLLEQPDREAGLAAYVGRYGEGVAAVYLERPRFMPSASPNGRPARPWPTALGRRGWLLPHEWPWGPFVIALESR
jgi:hypothetical protein